MNVEKIVIKRNNIWPRLVKRSITFSKEETTFRYESYHCYVAHHLLFLSMSNFYPHLTHLHLSHSRFPYKVEPGYATTVGIYRGAKNGVDQSIGPKAIIKVRIISHFKRIFKALSEWVVQLICCPTITLLFNIGV